MSKKTKSQAVPTPMTADPTEGLTGVPKALAEALLAEPGGTAALLSLDAGVSRSTASRVLAAMEAQGLVRRVSDGDNRKPDRWYFAAQSAEAPAPERGPGAEGEGQGAELSGEAELPQAAAHEAEVRQLLEEDNSSGDAGIDVPQTVEEAVSPGEAGEATESAEDGPEERAPEGDGSTVAADPQSQELPAPATEGQQQAGTDDSETGAQEAPTGDSTPPVPASAPVVPPGEPCPTCGHRAPTLAQQNGSRLGQGQLHQLALDQLRTHPEAEWTATGIAKIIGRSSGAIANALVTMVNRGEAEMTCAAPRRYRALAVNPAPVPPTGE